MFSWGYTEFGPNLQRGEIDTCPPLCFSTFRMTSLRAAVVYILPGTCYVLILYTREDCICVFPFRSDTVTQPWQEVFS